MHHLPLCTESSRAKILQHWGIGDVSLSGTEEAASWGADREGSTCVHEADSARGPAAHGAETFQASRPPSPGMMVEMFWICAARNHYVAHLLKWLLQVLLFEEHLRALWVGPPYPHIIVQHSTTSTARWFQHEWYVFINSKSDWLFAYLKRRILLRATGEDAEAAGAGVRSAGTHHEGMHLPASYLRLCHSRAHCSLACRRLWRRQH